MSVWTIQGQAAKALDATSRTLEELAIESAQVDFKSLDVDEFTFTISPDDITTATIPELGQTVTLFRNGTRFFHGHVTANPTTIRSKQQTCTVTVSGPWWWLDRINLTSTKTDGTGATAERLSYVFGTTSGGVNLKTAIEALIDRCITLGGPLTRGSVATFFTVPRITLNQSSCSQALAELVRLVPDTMTAFDYTTSPPTLNVTRRGTASVVTFTVGTSPIDGMTINPVYEMKVDRIDLDSVTRDAQGRTQFLNQNSGTVTTGRNLRLNISGPELDTFLPNDLFDTFNLQTSALTGSGFVNYLIAKDSGLAALAKKYSFTASSWPMTLVTTTGVTIYQEFNTTTNQLTTPYTYPVSPATFLKSDGTAISTSGKTLVLSDKPPEWADQFNVEEVKVKASFYYIKDDYYATSSGTAPLADPAWLQEVSWSLKQLAAGKDGLGGSKVTTVTYYRKDVEVSGYLINASYPTSTAIYREADYTFLNPPSGLAANLLAAQNFVPYAGSIDLIEQTAGGTRYCGKVVNVASSLSAYSTMKALVESESLDLKSGSTSIGLGTPARLDYRTFTDRIRRTPQDNIEYL